MLLLEFSCCCCLAAAVLLLLKLHSEAVKTHLRNMVRAISDLATSLVVLVAVVVADAVAVAVVAVAVAIVVDVAAFNLFGRQQQSVRPTVNE